MKKLTYAEMLSKLCTTCTVSEYEEMLSQLRTDKGSNYTDTVFSRYTETPEKAKHRPTGFLFEVVERVWKNNYAQDVGVISKPTGEVIEEMMLEEGIHVVFEPYSGD